MSNSENNRPSIPKVNWIDGINPENVDFQADQDGVLKHTAYTVNDFHGSGVLQKNPVMLPPILDTFKPNIGNISFSTLNAGNYDGKGIFVDRQPVDVVYGDQLLVTVENVEIPLYNKLKVIIFGKVYDPNEPQGTPVLETLVFDKAGFQATFNYYKSVIAVFFTNFSGGAGRTYLSALSQTSLNTSIIGVTGRITIKEVGPLHVLDHGITIHQTETPNLDVRDFITSTITRTFVDELTFIVNTAQNTGYVPVSISDINFLQLDVSGLANKPFLDSTTNGVLYGQKVLLNTNNIQQVSFVLSLADDAYGWSGELVIGIRPLQTTSINQFANRVDLDPDVNIVFEASFTQDDLLNSGYVLTTTPQEINFNFIGSALAQPDAVLIADQYYVITLTRRANTSTGKIFIDAGPKKLTNSKFTTFNPTTRAWTDDTQNDLWFKIYSSAIRVSAGIAYTNDGSMISLQKTVTNEDGSIVSAIAGPYSLKLVDSVASDNVVILQSTQEFQDRSEHPRTGNLVFLRIIDKVTITVLNTTEFNNLIASTNDVNKSNFPIVLAAVQDLNNKVNISYNGVITFPGQVRHNQIVLFNTNIQDDILKINNVIIPNSATVGVKYRITDAVTTTQYLGDFNNDKVFTSSDLVTQAIVQDTFSSQSTNVFTGSAYDPYSIFDPRSRDALGFGKETLERFILSDVDGYLTINSADVARLQYLTTTLPVLVTPSPTTIKTQLITVENITSVNNPIIVVQITDLDGYADAVFPDQLSFTALNVGDMRAVSVGDTVNLSIDGFTTTSYTDLVIEKFVQRNDLIIETRFPSDVLPTVDTSYVLSFYSQNPVFNNKLGVFGEVATEVLEFVAPGIDIVVANILAGDKVKITYDLLGTSRNGLYTVSQVINATTFRVASPVLSITAGVANAGIEFFTSDSITDKLSDTAVVQFTVNSINLTTSNIQEGDVLHITLGPVALNGTYTVARVISATVFTVVPPFVPLTVQSFTATFEFRAAGDIIVKIAPTSIINAQIASGPTPQQIIGLESLAPALLPNNVDTIFAFSLTHVPITGTAHVYWTSNGINKVMTFDAAPVQITGDGNPANSSINRVTGAITLDTFLPPDSGTNITVDYMVAPTVVLKHCYPTVVNAVSLTQTDIEFKVPFINAIPNTDIQGVASSSYVIIQTNNADPPGTILDSSSNVVAGLVTVNTINLSQDVIVPSRNVVLQLTNSSGNAPNITSGQYWMRIYSGTRVNVQAIQKEFLSDTLSINSPVNWRIEKNNFEWLRSNLSIVDYRRFLPTAFVSKIDSATYTSKNEMWVPADLYVGNGEVLSAPGIPYHGDLEITQREIELPVTALLSNSINVYNNIIASYGPTPGITRAGRIAMKFSDGTYVGADDNGLDTALSRNQVRVTTTFNSLYLDGYQVPNASVYTDLDEVLTKLHYEIRSGMKYDYSNGILYFHIANIKAIFENEPIVQTGIFRIVLDIALKKSGFLNPVETINSVDVGRLFTTPIEIIPVSRYSIAGEIVAGFTVGKTNDNPDG